MTKPLPTTQTPELYLKIELVQSVFQSWKSTDEFSARLTEIHKRRAYTSAFDFDQPMNELYRG
jgi:hypothetical protein